MFTKILCALGHHPASALVDTGMAFPGMKSMQRKEQHQMTCSVCHRNTVGWVLRWPYNLTPEQQKTALSPEEKVKYGLQDAIG